MLVTGKEITTDIALKAMECKSVEELMELAKAEGFELTKDEAEAYFAEMNDVELNEEKLKAVAGGVCWTNCPSESDCNGHVCGMVGWTNFKGC